MKYMRLALEKDAGMLQSIGGFVKHPVSTTLKKVFWSRAKPGEYFKNLGEQTMPNFKWGAGIAAGGTAVSPFFVNRPV